MSHPKSHDVVRHQQCRLVVVQDQTQPCPYLDDVTARMPLRLPVGNVTPGAIDEMLSLGFRRSGDFAYRTECPTCTQCHPTRVNVAKFDLTRSMKRVLNRGDRELKCTWQMPEVDFKRADLFNLHRRERKLGSPDEVVSPESYRSFLVDSFCETQELSLWLSDELISVSIVDIGASSISAVYTHFNPDYHRYSLGTYAILKQIEWARRNQKNFVYLGMYVANNAHLNYKARFMPQERLVDGEWIAFDRCEREQE
ncbi:arginyl-tRNA-protein transferase [Rubripirellula amarantea]|uniref:Arginyl-tRNA-protein transferase n=1 Tax=Rubripirellula amarantea TaxID=2527999 RepID=A0A5C5WUY3_9BACT|nr:arginyltransferase [Rubripirellula amarantea]TWT54418.1 arginyl-tRNA-protein transferase [Rubripirellula amarantea]